MSKVRRIRRYQQIASKMLKTRVLQQDPFLRGTIPETLWYTRRNLEEMLERYGTVFVKPDKGGGGVGILRVEMRMRGAFASVFTRVAGKWTGVASSPPLNPVSPRKALSDPAGESPLPLPRVSL